ncbi:(deoxy)nucleoside triphosphate pyrophosphohydrolase [Enterococcus faecalis]|uniref:(deoxy)nucleoside triphosphate pyrophosphohydrolase n=1 Tax=Enterococcus sp. DIV1375a TaxID=2774755 RepID=UPI0019ED5F6C|nr:(deoxy)nucleoside triphosphate pyrophosphohydrolase [Enterococcus faecalis]EGO9442811.1 (deoxy)nucleoside triphosphate pyrophosphohydrolase [Enterococcus faecalis]EKJ5046288.1 (deoxy)nucleoside triphosphate pyrophosphohydrolase [Enterococcus faecalis]EKL7552698.1 (deoxy)nucleoside triphosphate pyrophosphohydrolase [Enterococcus faecalis]EKZ0097644.1 (deoxy)nucleoside triphosphate pyrophosphohydrolase [Enterococcus faecalis]
MKKEIHVVGAIIVGNGKVLCCQRGPERALANLWEFPGGKIENGETKVQALERELQEELKIEVTIVKEEYAFCRYEYDFGFVNLTTFICYLESGEPQLTEHLQIKWLTPNELNQLEWAPADIPTVEKLVEKGVGTEQNG